ncbi:MAG: transglycosylase SLT domain-containing protein [Deltaproteobacteria bacterium]|nr:transglycosylase SLT domain-containing protein [Deltaproteobacteria bacterium]
MDGREKHTQLLKLPLLALASAAFTMLGGCATHGVKPEGGAVGAIIREANGAPPLVVASEPSRGSRSVQPVVSTGQVEVWGQRLKNSKFDYPVVVNPSVEHWLTYFTGKGRKYFDKYLQRGRYFIPTISKVLKQHNMPQDLVYLAMIESGFNNSARSRARAVGPWQFIRQTGQRYGLTVDYWLDERRDTRKSTLAAVAYLKELYQEFGSWELAAAGYNAGENKVRRAIAKYRSSDFWEIARHKFFKRETRDYVPKIIAAAIITKNPEQFGFVNPFNGKGEKNPTLLASDDKATVADDELTPKELGESLAKDEVSDDPADKGDEVASSDDDEDETPDAAAVSGTPNPTMTPSIYMVANPNEQIIEFEIKGPADLFALSKASGLPFSTIKVLNPELLRWCTPPTMKTYRIRLPLSVKDRFLATYNDESFDRRVVFMQYKVRKGDNIQKVAKRYNIEGQPIRELNQFDLHANNLRVGSSIALPIPTGYKRVIASMYDEKPEKPSRRRGRRHRRRHRQTSEARHDSRLRPSLGRSDKTG